MPNASILSSIRDTAEHLRENMQDEDWRESVKAELSLLPRLAGTTVPMLVDLRRGARNSLLEIVQENAHEAPMDLALEMDDVRMTWRELDRYTSRAAHVLRANGVRRGDVVALVGKNSPTYVALVFAATRAGATTAMINSNLTGKPLSHAITVSKANVVLVEKDLRGAVDEREDLADFQIIDYGTGACAG